MAGSAPCTGPRLGGPCLALGTPTAPKALLHPKHAAPHCLSAQGLPVQSLPGPEYFQIVDYSICTQGSLFLWLFCFTFLNPKLTLLKRTKQPPNLQCLIGSGSFHPSVEKLSMSNRPKKAEDGSFEMAAFSTKYN